MVPTPARGIWLVTFRFDPEECTAPTRERIADDVTVEQWWLRHQSAAPWEGECTTPIVTHSSRHLLEDIRESHGGPVVARYVFDATYANAHPACEDNEHLAILHGTLAAKLLDEGAIVLDREGLIASLRWPAIESRGVRFSRKGERRWER